MHLTPSKSCFLSAILDVCFFLLDAGANFQGIKNLFMSLVSNVRCTKSAKFVVLIVVYSKKSVGKVISKFLLLSSCSSWGYKV